MRTALLCWSYPPARNGLANAAAEIAGALHESGHAVVVVTMDRTGASVQDGVPVIGCAPGPLLSRLRGIGCVGHLVPPWLFWRAVRRLHRDRPLSVVEATNWYAPGVAIAMFGPVGLVTRNSTPAAITASGGRRASWRDRVDHRFATWLERVSARRSAGLISNTEPHGRTIAARYGVPPPGPSHAVIGLSLPARVRDRGADAAYPPAGAGLLVLFVGRAEPRKGFAELVGAAAMLGREADAGAVPAFELVLVGIDAPDAVPASLRHRVRLERDLPEAALHALLADAHVVAAPSRYESFGLVYQEAMAFGRPILACAEDASAHRFVGDTGAGLLAERCEAVAIAAVLRRLLQDASLRQVLHVSSRAAAGMFTRAGLATETTALYRIASRAAGRRGWLFLRVPVCFGP